MRIPVTTLAAGLITLCAAAAGLTTGAAPAHAAPFEQLDNKEGATDAVSCVKVTTRAPYRGFGYDHVVDLENKCDRPQTCKVKTNVNPEVQSVKVPVGKSESVTTFRGSPAREFKAEVECKADAGA